LGDFRTKGLDVRFPGGETIKVTAEDTIEFLTRGTGKASMQEAVLFLAYCASRGLNPLEGDAYLIKFDEKNPAQVVLGKGGHLKLAERQENFVQQTSGVIVSDRNGELKYRQSEFYDRNSETLIGGWAEVHRKDKPLPYRKEVLLEEYNRHQAMWKSMPATMISKVALTHAIREAFPDLGVSAALAEEELGEREEDVARKRFWVGASKLGYTEDDVHSILNVSSVNDWIKQGRTWDEAPRCSQGSKDGKAGRGGRGKGATTVQDLWGSGNVGLQELL